MDRTLAVEVAYGGNDRVYLCNVQVHPGATVAYVLAASDLARCHPELDLDRVPVGIHGRKVTRDHVVQAGDRVEVYRSLRIDPMQARRRRAARRERT